MKPVKIFVLLLFAVFSYNVAASGICYFDGDIDQAQKHEVIALMAMGGGGLLPKASATTSLGLLSKSYFTDSPMDRPLSRSDKALWDYLQGNKSRAQTVEMLRKGDLKIETYAEQLLFTIPISTAGTRDLFTSATGYFEGRIPEEWNQGQLPEGFNIAVSHVRLGYATDAAITVPEGDVDYVTQPNSWPAALRNGKIVIYQNNAIVAQFRGMYAGSQAASVNNAVEGDGLEFQKPFILEEAKGTKISLVCPQSVAFPATPAGLFVSLNIFGSAVRPMN